MILFHLSLLPFSMIISVINKDGYMTKFLPINFMVSLMNCLFIISDAWNITSEIVKTE